MSRGRRVRWGSVPRWGRWVAAGYVVGFLEGGCAHLLDLLRGGIHVYAPIAAVPWQVFFVGLVVLDPLVVVLVAGRRAAGVWLAGAVMAADVVANWAVDWQWVREDPGWALRPVGLLPITLFGVFVLATCAPLARAVESGGRVRAGVGSVPG
ncbi:hypothetical protein DQ392_21230 [Streptomyces reniochalinae]|uniref:Uncharacterized protein n=1 Tax=Streptomyces reniochalinae TaxID=2250578 RepID=A0A367EGJ7_9ACTN|nr:hypothetical protein DQ392_21230 [Streptomyces reniochalinae]